MHTGFVLLDQKEM